MGRWVGGKVGRGVLAVRLKDTTCSKKCYRIAGIRSNPAMVFTGYTLQHKYHVSLKDRVH